MVADAEPVVVLSEPVGDRALIGAGDGGLGASRAACALGPVAASDWGAEDEAVATERIDERAKDDWATPVAPIWL